MGDLWLRQLVGNAGIVALASAAVSYTTLLVLGAAFLLIAGGALCTVWWLQ